MQTPGSEMWNRPWARAGQGAPGGPNPPIDYNLTQVILDQLTVTPDVRSELILFLRRAIEEDRYYVPEELVAEKMIRRYLVENVF